MVAMVQQSSLSISYDGPALQDGRIDVQTLAPALLAVGQLFDAANRVVYGEDATIKVHVSATRKGSFEVILGIDQNFIQQAIQFLNSKEVAAVINLNDLLIGGGVALAGLLGFIKWLAGRDPDSIEKISDDVVRITIEGNSIDVSNTVLRLYENLEVRDALHRLIADPLEQEGVEKFTVNNESLREQVSKEEAPSFRRPSFSEQLLTDETRQIAFSIVSLTFKEENKWRLHDGDASISATITDQEFLDRVAKNDIAFAKDDLLICEVRMKQFRSGNSLKTEHVIQKVLEHKPAARQIDMRLEDHPKN